MEFRAIAKSSRLPFLILTPACVFLGVSTVVAHQIEVDWNLLILTLVGAVLAHISVNTLNEYCDFKSGLDLNTQKTQFSGGSGALPGNPETAPLVLLAGVLTFIGTLMIGIFFVWRFGAGIIPIGIAGLVLLVAYTPWITKHPFLCLVAPGLGFGFLMVGGTYFALTGEYSFLPWLVGIVPFCLVNNLLLLNQYPDIQADSEVGRNNILIARGTRVGNLVYGLFVIIAILAIILLVLAGGLPSLSLVALLPMIFAFYALRGAVKYGDTIGNYPQYLGANVVAAVFTPPLLGLSIIFS